AFRRLAFISRTAMVPPMTVDKLEPSGTKLTKSDLVSVATAALVAMVAGVGGTLPIVLAAAAAVGATPAEASSWVSGLGLATALSALLLSVRYRMPIITAWSTPGAALIASTAGVPSFRAAIGAFVL